MRQGAAIAVTQSNNNAALADLITAQTAVDAVLAKIARTSLAAEMGVEESPKNLSNKVGRGSFTAGFMLQCLEVIGVKELHL